MSNFLLTILLKLTIILRIDENNVLKTLLIFIINLPDYKKAASFKGGDRYPKTIDSRILEACRIFVQRITH